MNLVMILLFILLPFLLILLHLVVIFLLAYILLFVLLFLFFVFSTYDCHVFPNLDVMVSKFEHVEETYHEYPTKEPIPKNSFFILMGKSLKIWIKRVGESTNMLSFGWRMLLISEKSSMVLTRKNPLSIFQKMNLMFKI